MAWVQDKGYPKKLQPVLVPIEQYKTESTPKYNARVYQWRIWLESERPMQSYATDNEVWAFEAWAVKEKAARLAASD